MILIFFSLKLFTLFLEKILILNSNIHSHNTILEGLHLFDSELINQNFIKHP